MLNIMYILFQVSSIFLISVACVEINRENNTRQYADTQLTDDYGRPFIIIPEESNNTDDNIFSEEKELEKKNYQRKKV